MRMSRNGERALEEAKKEIERFYPNNMVEKKGYFGESVEEYLLATYGQERFCARILHAGLRFL